MPEQEGEVSIVVCRVDMEASPMAMLATEAVTVSSCEPLPFSSSEDGVLLPSSRMLR